MTRQADAAVYYATVFAARLDDFVVHNGTMWVRAGHPLTPQAVLDGLAGDGPSVSGYFLNPDSTGHVAAIDFDSDDGLDLARRCRAALAKRDAPAWVEASRRGAHLWVVVDAVRPGSVLRKFLRAVLADAGIEETPKVELRPAQDAIRADGYGAPLRLPTMPNPKTGLRYPMLDAQDRPLPRALDAMMLAIDQTPAWVVDSLASSLRIDPKRLPADYLPPRCIRQGPVESVVAVLEELWGVQRAIPGHACVCPMHDDKMPSLSIAHDEERVFCKSPRCVAYNDGRGRGPGELRLIHAGKLS
jgi:hypothetical protein